MIEILGQLSFAEDGKLRNKVEISIKRLQAFEPPDGYWHAMSFGKDSQAVYLLLCMAKVRFESHYSVTSVDPPELLQFGKRQYPETIWDRRYDENGKPVTMWNLIPKKLMPPTRLVRYCCEELKESHGMGRVTVTGVRWQESANRKENQAIVTFPSKSKKLKQHKPKSLPNKMRQRLRKHIRWRSG